MVLVELKALYEKTIRFSKPPLHYSKLARSKYYEVFKVEEVTSGDPSTLVTVASTCPRRVDQPRLLHLLTHENVRHLLFHTIILD